MNSRSLRVALVSLIMIMSCLAGCLSTEDVSDEDGAASLGKVVASTYHVEQLLKAVAGDTLEVELLSPTNVPVHDFEPSASDILKLQDADVFFYHGLGLEPWVEPTLDSLSLAAPTSVSTHAMPTGETTLDYESILISELCELAEGPFERTNLSMNEISMHDIHAEHVTHSMWFPEMDHEHDDDGHGDDHDDHDDDHDDENGDHDDHSGHGHASPMDTITNPSGCPTDYVIVIYELEKGDVVIEFEAEDDHNFNLTVLKMGGGHHHHAHDDHDDHVDEDRDREEHEGHDDHDEHDEITEEDCERRNGTWEEDPDHVGEFHCDLGQGDHDEHDEMTPEMVLQMADSNNDSQISWDEFWVVFNSDEHDDDHDDDHGDNHDDHNESNDDMDEVMEEYMMGLFYAAFNESDMYYYNDGNNDAGDGLLNMSELAIFIEEIEHLEEDMESASITILISMFDADDDGNLSLSEFTSFMEISNDGQDDHDDHDETMMMEMMFNMTDANSDGFVNASELEMLMEMGDDGHDDEQHGVIGFANLHVEEEGQYGFLLPSDVTMHVLASRDAHEGHGHEDHDDHVDEDRDREEHEGHDDHDEHDEITEEDCERRNGTWEEDPDHIGEFHCDLGQGDHDEHDEEERDGHDDHAEHDEHSEEIPYDPHSWLDPVAFKSQIDVVLEALVTAFPSGEADFTANADAYKIQLDSISAGFENAFGEGGTCTADKTVVANHNAYSYLAQRYDIEFVTIHGVDAEGEPSAEDIVEVVETINEEQITVLFVEEFTDPTSVESIVTQTGVTVLYLYTMEMPPSSPGEDYLSLMQKNLENLIIGIGC